jgi:hypothetical protein
MIDRTTLSRMAMGKRRIQQFGYEIRLAVMRSYVEHRKNVRVVQPASGSRLQFKTVQTLGVGCKIRRSNLDSNVSANLAQ